MERRLRAVTAAVLFGGLGLTAFVVSLMVAVAGERDRQTFEANGRNAEAAVMERVETSIALLRGVAGLMASQGALVTVDAYRAYLGRLGLREQYPGILGIGFSRRLAPQDVPGFERRIREQGHDDFMIWPDHPREEWHTIVFLEPLDERNRQALGFDMFTDPGRARAMSRARDTGEAAASTIVELLQEIDALKQPGFLIYLPVYRGGGIPESVEARRQALLGFAYAPIRAIDFFSSAFGMDRPPLALSLHEGETATPQSLLFEYQPADMVAAPRFREERVVEVAGRPWTFVFRSASSMFRAWSTPVLVAVAGATLSLLLSILFWREDGARRRVHEALEREQAARGQAERANRMKDQFLATLSHELRTPLNAIVGWAELLRHKGLSEQQVATGLDTVDRNARAQARLIDDLLDMNRISSGKLSMKMEPVEVAAVLDDALASVMNVAQGKGLRIEKSLPSRSLRVCADPARLQQVFWNLLSNAVKFTPAGGSVAISLQEADGRVRLSVSDSGEGIAPEQLKHIFDPFAQADGSITRRHGGLGLGLAIARDLVVLHGGVIQARSAGEGRGATFVVELPKLEAVTAEPGGVQEVSAQVSLEDARVLLVDDEPDARNLVRMILEQRGARVLTAGSAPQALELLDDFRPSAVVSDIGMPGMNGYEFMRVLRRRAPEEGGAVPAVALTAYAREEDRAEALRAGYQVYIVKPVRPNELLVALSQLLKLEEIPRARRAG